MKLTKRKLINLIKEEISSYKNESQTLNEMVDPAAIAALQQAFTLDPRAFKIMIDAISLIPTIPSEWRKAAAAQAAKKADVEPTKAEKDLEDLLDALGEFRGESYTDDQKDSFRRAAKGEIDL